jgi:DNA repair exonuclease SbcCD nuclease subunit
MKLAITGDIHLTKKDNHPERWNTFENIIKSLQNEGIQTLVIAGDLFHADYKNYSSFDELVSKHSVRLIIIPGNHDSKITQRSFTSDNIEIYHQPEILNFGDTEFPFLFIPYKNEVSMGAEISSFKDKLPDNEWVLISHGDWAENIKTPNPVEPGIYMPLSRKDIKKYKPKLTILGHIHKPEDYKKQEVYYPGSPCGLNIEESGRRRILILDTENLDITPLTVDSEILYFDETIIVYPLENEKKYWQGQVKQVKDKWDLTDQEKSKSIIRIKVKGFSSNKRELKNYLDSEFEDYTFYKDGEVDVGEVNDSDDFELMKISEKVTEKINRLELDQIEGQPSQEDILYKAIEKIYSIK